MINVGITERGDAGINLNWVAKLQPANILITKNVTSQFITAVVKAHNQGHKIIVHATCTGLGSKPVEPNVPDKFYTYNQVKTLILAGFPVEQIVLRIDPIIPTKAGIKTALSVLELFEDLGIKRVRYSFLDMYRHVLERFVNNKIPVRYSTKHASKEMQQDFLNAIKPHESVYEFESCAEYTPHRLGCVSVKDFKVLGIDLNEMATNKKGQRGACLCVANKAELLTERKPCPHNCLYCYWRD